MPTRDEALELLFAHTDSESLRRHCLMVETGCRAYAERLGEDVEEWGLAGLLHDFDYEKHPDEHPLWGLELLRGLGYSEDVLHAIAAHYEAKTGVAIETPLDRHLYACDEMSGFIAACVYVRPSKSVMDLEVKSVLKKMKEKSFAAPVPREDLVRGAELVGLPIEEHIAVLIEAFRARAAELGL